MSDAYLPSLEPYDGWNASYQWAAKIRKSAGETSRAYVTRAGNVKIRPGSQPGSTRSHKWQWDAYALCMATGEWDAHNEDATNRARRSPFADRKAA